ncbi:hypothetical protein MASR1M32_24230 [Rhodobacter sp.]
MAFLQQQKPHLAQGLAVGDGFAAIGGGADQHEGLGEQRHLLKRRLADRQGQKGAVQPPLGQIAQQAGVIVSRRVRSSAG